MFYFCSKVAVEPEKVVPVIEAVFPTTSRPSIHPDDVSTAVKVADEVQTNCCISASTDSLNNFALSNCDTPNAAGDSTTKCKSFESIDCAASTSSFSVEQSSHNNEVIRDVCRWKSLDSIDVAAALNGSGKRKGTALTGNDTKSYRLSN